MQNLDERNNKCPLPVIHTMEACKKMNVGDVLCVKVNEQIKVENITRFAKNKGYDIDVKKNAEDDIDLIITIKEEIKNNCSCDCGGHNKNIVVAIGSDKMGCGDETLGHNLLKAFIFSLTKQEELPNTMVFYNSGVRVTTEGSESLEDLKTLSDAGVNILSCGTCLDFYQLKDKLKVGNVTNMYDIVAIMEMSTALLKP